MTKETEQIKELKEIRNLMERSSSFLSLSGLSGISAGIFGLIMGILLQIRIAPYLSAENYSKISNTTRTEIITYSIIISIAILIVTLAAALYFSIRKAKIKNSHVWDTPAKQFLTNLLIPLVTGGIFCIIMVIQKYDWLIFPSMLIFFGLALVNGSKYTLHEIKWLGLCEIFLGLAALILPPEKQIIMWTLGFGLMNIVYGIIMYYKHERV